MANSEALKINLAALRKVDSSISSIVDSANQVALYKYISDDGKWEKTDIEGTLFVYMRAQKPQHGFMVMNRLSTTNLVEPITENLDFQDQTPFLLYRNGKGSIYGMWFYEEKNCLKIFKLLSSLSEIAFKPDKSNSIRQRSYSESNRKHQKQEAAQMDIISLLTRAQDEYDKKSAKVYQKGSKASPHPSNGDIVKPTPVRVNGAVTAPSDTKPLTIGMLFAQAGGIQKKPNEDPIDFNSRIRSFTASNASSSNNSAETILQNLLSNSAHTLQHIEGKPDQPHGKGPDQHIKGKPDQPHGKRSDQHIKGKPDQPHVKLSDQLLQHIKGKPDEKVFSMESLEKDLKAKLNIVSNCDVSDAVPAKSEPIDIPILTPAMLESSFSSVPTAVGSFMDKADPGNISFPSIRESGSFSPSQLLSPMDFTIPNRKMSRQFSQPASSYSPEPGSTLFNGNGSSSHEDLIHPQSLLNGPFAGHLQPAGKPSSVTPLNKDQFKEALVYMIQNEDDFVIQLHECYVKSLKTQLNFIATS